MSLIDGFRNRQSGLNGGQGRGGGRVRKHWGGLAHRSRPHFLQCACVSSHPSSSSSLSPGPSPVAKAFFPLHNESFHGAFGLVNLHGVPKPTYRAYQVNQPCCEECPRARQLFGLCVCGRWCVPLVASFLGRFASAPPPRGNRRVSTVFLVLSGCLLTQVLLRARLTAFACPPLQLLHEAGTVRLPVTPSQPRPRHNETCGVVLDVRTCLQCSPLPS
jgi:hypothetical protein